MDYARRISSVASRLGDEEIDALLVTDRLNVRYLTGFSGTNGQIVVTQSGAKFFTDARYEAQATEVVHDAEVIVYPQRLNDVLRPLLPDARIGRMGVEAETMTIATWQRLKKALTKCEIVPVSGLVESLRRAKDDQELALLREAMRLGDATFAAALDFILPGSSTERDIALFIESEFKRGGAENVSFPPIVASGPLSAHVHHTASDRVIEKGDLVVLDLGCELEGYCSDLTRTVAVGPATQTQLDMHAVVLQAQQAGIAATRAGAGGRDVDAAARGIIEQADVRGDFKHGLGHGVGLEVHEAPRLHRLSDDVLAAGDVVTVEPGVYATEGEGLRIEDCVVVSEEGAEVLTNAPKNELIQL